MRYLTHMALLATSAMVLAMPAQAQDTAIDTTEMDRMALACPEGRVAIVDDAPACERVDTLDRLIADFERLELAGNPIAAGERGDKDALRRLPDVGPETRTGASAFIAAMSRRHAALAGRPGFAQMSESDRLNYDLLGFVLEQRARLLPFDQDRLPFTNDSGFHTLMSYVSRQTSFQTADDYAAYAARLTQLPRYFAGQRANMRRGIDTGFTASSAILPGVIDSVRTLSQGAPLEHPLYAPFRDMPDRISKSEQARLRAMGEAAMTTSVLPAYRDLLAFFEDDYQPAARDSVGIGTTEEGRAYYTALVKHFTTLDITPDDVHQLGLREVARIRAEMDDVIREAGFPGSFAEFLRFLRTDPQFYAKSEDELLERAARLAKDIDGQMPAYFRTLPRLPYGVKKVPDEIAPGYTTGRYWGGSPEAGRAGYYVVNTYDLPSRPLYNLPALTAHEGVPGHHHQIALGQELMDLPEFRRSLYPTAFGEGWGLYSEKLAGEMGLYKTPYERFGQLSYEMWRACRLVVDTGMHWLGWTQEQAEGCFLENSALSEGNIKSEVERYISWPGQALAYKIGELKILELRQRAEAALGDRFDIRDFHDAVLLQGGLPLSVLERRIDAWIAEQQAR